jgi:ABC-type lipoprotein release transport system permease subunit
MNQLPVSPILLVPIAVTVLVIGALMAIGKVPLGYNLRNLVVRWWMTLLTGVAFAFVIGLLTVMLAFVNGMAELTAGSGHPDNVIVLSDGSNDEAFSTLVFSDASDVDYEPGIMRNDAGKPLVSKEVYIIASMPVAPKAGRTQALQIKGHVRKIMIDRNEFILTDEKGTDLVFRLTEDGRVFANGLEGKLDNLKPGDAVWLAYAEQGKERVVSEVQGSNRRHFVQVRGIEDPLVASQVHHLDLMPGGQWFSEAGVEDLPTTTGGNPETAVQAVIGSGVARELGHDLNKERLDVGDIFELGPKKWKVVGVMSSAGTTFDSEVWAKRSYVGELYGKPNMISSMTIRSTSPEAASELSTHLKNNFKKANLQPSTETEYYSKLRGINIQLLIGIGFLTFWMAIGGMFGVMNTMFAAISHRTKDIGVLRILGYARWQILVSFLLESLAIALVGGLVGAAIGSLFHGLSATSIVGSGQGGFGKTVILRLSVDANTLAIGFLLTLFMGGVGGFLPSFLAMRLKPLESLR